MSRKKMIPSWTFITVFLFICVCLLQSSIHAADASAADNIPELRKRQEEASPPAESPEQQPQPTNSNNNDVQPTQSNTAPQASNTGSALLPSDNGSAAGNASDNVAALPTSASFGNTIFPGMASFLTPKPSRSVSPVYRIDSRQNVTFVWEFKDLRVQPVNLTLAAVGPNSVAYTISVMQGAATSAVWNLGSIPDSQPDLMNAFYQIQLYDQRGLSAFHSPGWLSPQTGLTIGFYTLQPYGDTTATEGPGCPYCFNDNAVALGSAFGVACLTSAIVIYNLIF
ncbi:hypothetical protein BDA99DRAFT_511106 [Phascolomyces articulosus]|uniref:DUF7137 domain-containing protein n=1 Tax=Phascolomyces articulosus TaxID=60185 RepID=A0AAD5PFI1_9FUNG|nr:hypothetical protein BDA99DRAFT_511106 [Phascolomyces articulosus]